MTTGTPRPGSPDWPATPESRLVKPVTRALLNVVAHYVILGRENIPAAPPYIVASNHMSYWDVPVVTCACPYGTVGLAARKYVGTWKERFFRLYAVIWVEQFSADRGALRDAITVLKGGAALGVAPEGTRSRVNSLIAGRSGTAFIATRAGAPILPCAVWGTEKILKQPRPTVTVRFGRPFTLPEGRAKGDQLDEYTDRIMCAIAALLPEAYHGVYANHPLIEEMRACVL